MLVSLIVSNATWISGVSLIRKHPFRCIFLIFDRFISRIVEYLSGIFILLEYARISTPNVPWNSGVFIFCEYAKIFFFDVWWISGVFLFLEYARISFFDVPWISSVFIFLCHCFDRLKSPSHSCQCLPCLSQMVAGIPIMFIEDTFYVRIPIMFIENTANSWCLWIYSGQVRQGIDDRTDWNSVGCQTFGQKSLSSCLCKLLPTIHCGKAPHLVCLSCTMVTFSRQAPHRSTFPVERKKRIRKSFPICWQKFPLMANLTKPIVEKVNQIIPRRNTFDLDSTELYQDNSNNFHEIPFFRVFFGHTITSSDPLELEPSNKVK